MTNKTQLQEVKKLFELGAHLGHKKNRLHPKARKNVYTIVNGTSVIDLTKTVNQINTAKKFLAESAEKGKTILIVGTKKTASPAVRAFADEHKLPFITAKWLPGLLTNFKTIMQNVKKLKDYGEQDTQDAFKDMVKHERTRLQKAMNKLERLYGGIVSITKRPDILMVVDVKKEKNAVKEARAFNIPIVGIADTNADPDEITYPVVANDDDATVVEHVVQDLLSAYVDAFKAPVVETPTADKPHSAKSSAGGTKKEETEKEKKKVKKVN